MDQTYMKKQPVLGLVVKMSLPMVISMLVNSHYNIVDSLFVAKISENAMTALSLVFPLQNLIGAVMQAWGLVFEKVYQAIGRMTLTMVCLLSGCVLNIILDPVLIFGIGPFPLLPAEPWKHWAKDFLP